MRGALAVNITSAAVATINANVLLIIDGFFKAPDDLLEITRFDAINDSSGWTRAHPQVDFNVSGGKDESKGRLRRAFGDDQLVIDTVDAFDQTDGLLDLRFKVSRSD